MHGIPGITTVYLECDGTVFDWLDFQFVIPKNMPTQIKKISMLIKIMLLGILRILSSVTKAAKEQLKETFFSREVLSKSGTKDTF